MGDKWVEGQRLSHNNTCKMKAAHGTMEKFFFFLPLKWNKIEPEYVLISWVPIVLVLYSKM